MGGKRKSIIDQSNEAFDQAKSKMPKLTDLLKKEAKPQKDETENQMIKQKTEQQGEGKKEEPDKEQEEEPTCAKKEETKADLKKREVEETIIDESLTGLEDCLWGGFDEDKIEGKDGKDVKDGKSEDAQPRSDQDMPPKEDSLMPLTKISIREAIEKVNNSKGKDIMEELTGMQVNKDSIGDIAERVGKFAENLMDRSEKQVDELLGARDLKLLAEIEKVLETGDICSRSPMARKFYRANPMTSKKMSHEEGKIFRIQWAEGLKSELMKKVEKRVQTKSWTRVDSSKFVYRPLGKLVKDFGGWKDQDAIKGACTGFSDCRLIMTDIFVYFRSLLIFVFRFQILKLRSQIFDLIC